MAYLGGTVAGSHWINWISQEWDGFVVSCVLALLVLSKDGLLHFSYPSFLHKAGCILIVS